VLGQRCQQLPGPGPLTATNFRRLSQRQQSALGHLTAAAAATAARATAAAAEAATKVGIRAAAAIAVAARKLQPVSALDHATGNWQPATCCRIDNFARLEQAATVVVAAGVTVAVAVAVVNCQCFFYCLGCLVLPKPGLCKLQ